MTSALGGRAIPKYRRYYRPIVHLRSFCSHDSREPIQSRCVRPRAQREGNMKMLMALTEKASINKHCGTGHIAGKTSSLPITHLKYGDVPWIKKNRFAIRLAKTRSTWRSASYQGLWPGPIFRPGRPHERSVYGQRLKQVRGNGWGFGHFADGKPGDAAFMKNCFPCHEKATATDLVFTSYAP